ncbi:hypothetical protein COO60DRAFT_1630247 [Scenedesmus sp. NREL 46B-D3]|nr:hypothetical protein COO60DRAFT_1630247 [Scenedesmus sp. NREL 46B-D3]
MSTGTKLYVGNLSWSTTEEDLRQVFGQYGEVEDAFIPKDRETGRARGFAFVTLASGAQDAMANLNDQEFMGRTIRVNEAQPQGSGGRRLWWRSRRRRLRWPWRWWLRWRRLWWRPWRRRLRWWRWLPGWWRLRWRRLLSPARCPPGTPEVEHWGVGCRAQA